MFDLRDQCSLGNTYLAPLVGIWQLIQKRGLKLGERSNELWLVDSVVKSEDLSYLL